AGFAALGRVVVYVFGDALGGAGDWQWLLAVLAALTMTVGNLAALRQANLKRMLAYSSIAHAGYLLVGVAAGNEAGTGGLLFYLFAYAFANVGAFAAVIAGPGETLDDLAGLAASRRGLAAATALFMFSLAGVPPLAGFLGKLYVFGAAVQAGLAWLAVVGVINSAISAYYYLRVVARIYLAEDDAAAGEGALPAVPVLQVGVGLASLAVVVLGVWPGPVADLARLAARALGGG
ncbi:MAG: proton-conducting transporter membrane subunit, partial [Anaerolineae bacterium]